MVKRIILVYCLCDDFLKYHCQHDHCNTSMSTAEVMSTVVIAMLEFSGTIEQARIFLHEHGYIPRMLSKSRLNRRIHAIDLSLWWSLLDSLGEAFKSENHSQEYIIDSIPIAVLDNIRIRRATILSGEEHRGYCAAKRRFFYGLKLHLLVTADGKPVEMLLSPGAMHDMKALKHFRLDLPPGSVLIGDKAYNDGEFEQWLAAHAEIELRPIRKKKMKQQYAPYVVYLQQRSRKRIESVFSSISDLLPRRLRAVTVRGLVLKLMGFVLAFALRFL